uniref:Laminin N-terminal domain-containing protein n=1 Tax=Angiostrongylus cantonensis TaxID=6313 RepID=A0A0K0CT62_ANGCA
MSYHGGFTCNACNIFPGVIDFSVHDAKLDTQITGNVSYLQTSQYEKIKLLICSRMSVLSKAS